MSTFQHSEQTWEGSFRCTSKILCSTLPVDELPEVILDSKRSKGRRQQKKPLPQSRTGILHDTIDLTQEGQMNIIDVEVDLSQDDEYQKDLLPTTNSNSKSKRKNVKLRKENEKQKLAQAQPMEQAACELTKIYKPGECIKYMRIEMHPALASAWYMSDVPREAQAVGARLAPSTALCDTSLVTWTRAAPRTLGAGDGQVKLSPTYERCESALFVACAVDAAEHVGEHTLAEHIALKQDMVGCPLTLVIFGVKDYFKTSGRKTSNSRVKLMTEIDLEMAITDLLVSAGCDTVIANTPNELALLIMQFTKAIAKAPYKKQKRNFDEQADFYMRGDSKKSVAVDKDGNGVGRLWQQMIAVLPMSSLETSRALCAQYKSPVALYESLQSTDSLSILADIGVSRAAVPGAKARRLGPEFARKLHTLFTAEDGNILVE